MSRVFPSPCLTLHHSITYIELPTKRHVTIRTNVPNASQGPVVLWSNRRGVTPAKLFIDHVSSHDIDCGTAPDGACRQPSAASSLSERSSSHAVNNTLNLTCRRKCKLETVDVASVCHVCVLPHKRKRGAPEPVPRASQNRSRSTSAAYCNTACCLGRSSSLAYAM